MADGNLSQSEADALIAMEKIRAGEMENNYPEPGGKLTVPLTSRDGREGFTLDVSRSQINLAQGHPSESRSPDRRLDETGYRRPNSSKSRR